MTPSRSRSSSTATCAPWTSSCGTSSPTASSPEVTGDYAGLIFEDRDALVGYLRENLGNGLISMHHAHHPEIVVDGDQASGPWYLEDRGIVPDLDFVLEGAAFYTDRE